MINTIQKAKKFFSKQGVEKGEYFSPHWKLLGPKEIKELVKNNIDLDLLQEKVLELIGFDKEEDENSKKTNIFFIVQKADDDQSFYIPISILDSVEWAQGPYSYSFEPLYDENDVVIGNFHNIDAIFQSQHLVLTSYDEEDIIIPPKHAAELRDHIQEWLDIIEYKEETEQELKEEEIEKDHDDNDVGPGFEELAETGDISSITSLESVTERIKEEFFK
jgi:hypothetical protein